MKKLLSVILLLVLCVTAFAACRDKGPSSSSDLESAKNYLYSMYRENAETTPSDFQRVGVVKVYGVSYSVTWTVEITSGDKDGVKVVPGENNTVTIDVNEKAETEIVYTLTATLTDADGKTASVSFNHKVPAYRELGWADYVAAADGDPVVIKGTITGIIAKSKGNSSNCLYLQDENGGFYVYAMATDPVTDDKLEVGMTVRVTGTRSTYSGTYEITDAKVEILDSDKKVPAATDFTALYTAAATLKDEALVAKQGMLVTVKGVEISSEDESNGYYRFKLGDLETYVRISSSVCPLTKDEQTTLKEGHASHLGWIANVTGVICVYDGAFYLTPVTADAFEYISLPEKSDADMVAFEKANLTMPANITSDKVIDLVTKGLSYTQVNISWASDNACAVVADGKLTVTLPEADTVIKLTATLTSGDVTDTVEFEINLIAGDMTYAQIVDAAYKLAAGESLEGTYRLFGKIVSIDTAYSDQYKNVTVTIAVAGKEDKPIQCFRLKGEGCEALAVGDEITVEGTLKNYNGTFEFDSGCVFVGKGEILDPVKIVDNAYLLEENATMEGTFTLTGKVTSVDTAYSEQYQNVTVTITVEGREDKPIQCFRLKGEGANEVAVGDTITVTGTLKNYKGTVEFDANCTLDKLVPGSGSDNHETQDPGTDPTGDKVIFDFTTASTKEGAELDATSALALFNTAAGGASGLSSVQVTKIYDGTGSGGGKPNTSGIVKTGTGKVNGQIVLDFGSKKVSKVEIVCHDFYSMSEQYPTNSNRVSVNGSEAVLAPYTFDVTPGTLTFTLSEASGTVTIDTNYRVYIFSITVYFAD